MKYKIPVILIVLSIMLFSLISPSSYAKDTNLTSIYLMSKTCPKEYVDYAQENIGRYIYSLEPSERRSVKDMKLGSPFSFCNTDSDLFYFPIITNGSITHMLRVYKKSTGDCGAVIGKSFVQEINELASKTSIDSPLILMMEEDTVVAYINKERIIIQEYPQGTVGSDSYILPSEFEKVFSTKESEYIMVDITSECSDCAYISVNPAGGNEKSYPPYMFLGTSITETQGNQEWCAAFSTAFITRYVKGNNDSTSAQTVMSYFYTNPSNTDTIGESQVVQYANHRSLYPTYTTSTLSNSSLIDQIVSYKPVYLRMYRWDGSIKKYHAVVLRGYNDMTDSWSIWNPWYNYYDTFDMGGSYVPAEHQSREYIYFQTVYNW